MPKSSIVSIRIDPEIKIEADAILSYLGISPGILTISMER